MYGYEELRLCGSCNTYTQESTKYCINSGVCIPNKVTSSLSLSLSRFDFLGKHRHIGLCIQKEYEEKESRKRKKMNVDAMNRIS